MNNILKIVIGTLAALFLVALLVMFIMKFYQGAVDKNDGAPVTFHIQEGDGLQTIAKKLKEQRLIRSSTMFIVAAFWDNKFGKFYEGQYNLNRTMSLKEILNALTTPPDKRDEVEVTFLEGWTSAQYADTVEEQGFCSRDKFMDIVRRPAKYKIKTHGYKISNLEGFLFPNKYKIFVDATCPQVAQKLVDQFFKVFNKSRINKAVKLYRNFDIRVDEGSYKDRDLALLKAVTMAAMVEKEAQVASERPIVAGVYIRRLKIPMELQCDATYQYDHETGEWDGAVQGRNHERANPVYNTYKFQGLPPGPICNPGKAALDAAVNPELDLTYRFYVLKYDGTGKHFFSNNNSQHECFKGQGKKILPLRDEISKLKKDGYDKSDRRFKNLRAEINKKVETAEKICR